MRAESISFLFFLAIALHALIMHNICVTLSECHERQHDLRLGDCLQFVYHNMLGYFLCALFDTECLISVVSFACYPTQSPSSLR
jgi:hypothetical protein